MAARKLAMIWQPTTFLCPDIYYPPVSIISEFSSNLKRGFVWIAGEDLYFKLPPELRNRFFKELDTPKTQKSFLMKRLDGDGITYDHFEIQRVILPWIPAFTDEYTSYVKAQVGSELGISMRMDQTGFPYQEYWLIADTDAQRLTTPARNDEQLPLLYQTLTWVGTVLALVTEIADTAVADKPEARSPFGFDVAKMEGLRKAFQAVVDNELVAFRFSMERGAVRSMPKKDIRKEVRKFMAYVALRMSISRAVHLTIHMLPIEDIASNFLISLTKDLRMVSMASSTSVKLTIVTETSAEGHAGWEEWVQGCHLDENMEVSVTSGDESGQD
ncbi:hypothetical protein N0V87_008732 [Didymella glomerata]|uniref:Uncharacterized protein n=1 Tax=Didymella glomerata TaxID=749621 RepID=A0A9W8WSN8_9PLEO|nr:hypothetical protein N0V87_008732 [Didymella glomerata]